MKTLTMLFAAVAIAATIHAQTPDKASLVRAYFAGWEKKDWKLVRERLTDDFTFTSPAPDDHISVARFYDKCWVQAQHIKKFEFPKILIDGDQAMAIVHVHTADGRMIRNVELFTFRGDKVSSIEVFFGGHGEGFPTNK